MRGRITLSHEAPSLHLAVIGRTLPSSSLFAQLCYLLSPPSFYMSIPLSSPPPPPPPVLPSLFLSPRAAAHHQLGNFMAAVSDSERAAALDRRYGKAYSRLGHALLALGRAQEAIERGFKKGEGVGRVGIP